MLFVVYSSKHLKRETVEILYNHFQKIGEGTLLNSFYEASIIIILTPKSNKNNIRKPQTKGIYEMYQKSVIHVYGSVISQL